MSFSPIQQLFPNSSVIDLNCTICIEDFKPEDEVLAHTGINVPHAFHALCIGEWLKKSAKCPTCNLHVTHVNGVRIGLSHEVHINPWLEIRLRLAAERGDLQEVQAILQTNGVISETERGSALLDAVHNGHQAIVEALLASEPISEGERGGFAFRDAAYNGRLDIVQAFLARGGISETDRGYATRNAVFNGHLNIVETLLASGAISETNRGLATRAAANRGRRDIVQALLASGTISETDRELATGTAVNSGRLDIYHALSAHRIASRQRALSGEEERPSDAEPNQSIHRMH